MKTQSINKKIDVSIIIVNYNCADMLIDAIMSVTQHTIGLCHEIIVVDNGSREGEIEKLQKTLQDDIILITNPENIGFGGANNIGIKQARGKYIFLLNPDTLLQDNAIKQFYDFAETHQNQNIGALGCILTNKEGQAINSFGTFLTPSIILRRILHCIKPIQYSFIEQPKEVDFITGADLFIPRQVLTEIGLFDPRFFMYCEEMDLQKRMALKDYERILIPGTNIIHFDGATYTQKNRRSANRRLQHDKSKCIYIRKYYNGFRYLFFKIAFFLCKIPAYINPHYTMKDNMKYLKMIITT